MDLASNNPPSGPNCDARHAATDIDKHLSVSNSLSGRHWELDQVPAVGDPTDIVQFGTGHHVAAGEDRRRVALQRRVALLHEDPLRVGWFGPYFS